MHGGNSSFENEEQGYEVCEVESIQAMEALISAEADSMSALGFRMSQADKSMWADIELYKNKGSLDKRRYRMSRAVVQACIHHPSEGWSWTKELVDTLHGWESQNIEIIGARTRKNKGICDGALSGVSDSHGKAQVCEALEVRRWSIFFCCAFGGL